MLCIVEKVDLNKYNILDTDDGVIEIADITTIMDLTARGIQIDGISCEGSEIKIGDTIIARAMLRGYRFRVYPSKTQIGMLNNIFGCCRFVWNKMLEDRISHYNTTGDSLVNHYNNYYVGNDFLKKVPARCLQMTERNLNTAYSNFYQRVRNNDKKAGFPKFKKKYSEQSFQIYNDNNCIVVENEAIRLPKLGWLKFKQHRNLQGRITTVTVRKTPADEYYVSMNVASWIPVYESKPDTIVGIDLGIKTLAVLSDGTQYENPDTLDKYLDTLRYYQRKLTEAKRGSNNRAKLQKKIAKLYAHIVNIRKDYIHKMTHEIVINNQVIITESLSVQNIMSNKTHSKKKQTRDRHIANASWFEITRQLEYKSNWYGKIFQKVNKFYPSTQLCSYCGYKNTDLRGNTSIRTWTCPTCNTIHDRDLNAAINIRNEGKKLLNIA